MKRKIVMLLASLILALNVVTNVQAEAIIAYDDTLVPYIEFIEMKPSKQKVSYGEEFYFLFYGHLLDGRTMEIPRSEVQRYRYILSEFINYRENGVFTARIPGDLVFEVKILGYWTIGGVIVNGEERVTPIVPNDSWYWKGDSIIGSFGHNASFDHARLQIQRSDGTYEEIRTNSAGVFGRGGEYLLPLAPRDQGTLYLQWYDGLRVSERLAIPPSPLKEPSFTTVKNGQLIGTAVGAQQLKLFADAEATKLIATIPVKTDGTFSWPIGRYQQQVVYGISYAGTKYESNRIRYFIDDRLELKQLRVVWGEKRTRVLQGYVSQTDKTMKLVVKFRTKTYEIPQPRATIQWRIPEEHRRESFTVQAVTLEGRQSKVVKVAQ